MMYQNCESTQCSHPSLAICRCCHQTLCREHFVEHDYCIGLRFNHLISEIDHLSSQLDQFDVQHLVRDVFNQLTQWRLDSHQTIERFYEKKCEEISQSVSEILKSQQEQSEEVRSNIIKMINLQRTTNEDLKKLICDVDELRQQLKDIQRMSIQIHLSPLIVDDSSMDTKTFVLVPADLSKLSIVDQRINRLPLSSNAMISNDRYLLIHQNSHLMLMDENLCVVDDIKWPFDWIRDMTWSRTLNYFILITTNDVYQVHGDTLAVERLENIKGNSWQSCTCSETSLFLCSETGPSSIKEFSLTQPMKFARQWKRNQSNEKQQRIDSISYQNQKLALAINDPIEQKIFIELRSIDQLECLWSCPLFIDYSERKLQLSRFQRNQWIVADWGTSSLFQIDQQGQVEKTVKYKSEIHHVTLWNLNTLVISTNNHFYFHRI